MVALCGTLTCQFTSQIILKLFRREAIFPGMSYVDILNHINLSTLKERRDYLCKKYFLNMQASSHTVNCLLPEKRHVDYDLRSVNMYPLPVTRTNIIQEFVNPMGIITHGNN